MDLFCYRPPSGGYFEHPAREGEPAIWIYSFGERIAAGFVLELTSVRQLGERENHTDPRTTGSFLGWPPVLAGSDTVRVVLRAANGTLRCLVKGGVVGTDSTEAVSAARMLWRNLLVGLSGAAEDLCFVPSPHPNDYIDTNYPFYYSMAPTGLLVEAADRPPIGFVRGQNSTAARLRFSLPAEVPAGALDTLADRLLDVPEPAELRFTLRGASVTDHLTALRSVAGNPALLHSADGQATSDPAVVNWALAFLAACVQARTGVTVDAVLGAGEELPQTLLGLAGRAVFGTQPTISQPLLDAHVRDDDDLRGFVPAGIPAPLSFPCGAYFRRQGMRVTHPRVPVDLPGSGVLLGLAGAAGRRRELRLDERDRSRHCYVIGATGTGKSTLLFNMIHQDMECGAGVCLLDPHGDLYAQVLDAVPPGRADDVILIDASDFERAVGINFLETSGEYADIQASFITNELMKIFDRLYDMKVAGGPVFEQYMRNSLLLLMQNRRSGGTLVDVERLFTNADYRDDLIENCTNRLVAEFWRGIAHKAQGELTLENIAPYITSKLNQFICNALLRPIVGQERTTVDFGNCMKEGKILLVNLAKGRIGEWDARFLGMLILGKLFGAATARAALAGAVRRPFYLYVDEAQNLATDTMATIMAEGRKFGLVLTLANQTFSQIKGAEQGNLMQAVLGNAGTLLLFRVGPLDSEQLVSFIAPVFSRHDVETLENRHVLARMLNEGRPMAPFIFETCPPRGGEADVARLAEIRRRIEVNRLAYTRPARAVDDSARIQQAGRG